MLGDSVSGQPKYFYYMLNIAPYHLSKQFHVTMLRLRYDAKDPSLFFADGKKVFLKKDSLGQPIKGRHSLRELSDAITDFQKGERTSLSNKTNIDYLRRKGMHFCAGYLSRFGDLGMDYDMSQITVWKRKIIEKKARKNALQVWKELRY